MKLIYIAGPYSGRTHDVRSYCEIERNISNAREAALWCARHDIAFFCPHLNTCHFETILPEVKKEFYLKLDLRVAEFCDGALMLPGWTESRGSRLEYEYFTQRQGFRIFDYPAERARLLEWSKECTSEERSTLLVKASMIGAKPGALGT